MFFFALSLETAHKFVLALLGIVCVLTLVSLLGNHLYLELATHFRWHYALVATICVILLIAFHSWKALPFALACALFNWSFVLPYYLGQPPSQASGSNLRLMLANVYEANQDYAAFFSAVREVKPDVVVLQELTPAWADQLHHLASEFPYVEAIPRPSGSGMGILSRYPLTGVEVLTLDSSTHVALLVTVQLEGAPVALLSLHPTTPVSPFKFTNRNRQFSEAATRLRAMKGSRILVGDLNTTMWSPYFQSLVRESGLIDARLGFGLSASWPNPLPGFLQIPIDHCLVSEEVEVTSVKTGPRTGSDHRPLVVDLRVEPER